MQLNYNHNNQGLHIMFNFKSLLLTTVATLGLAINIEACKGCRSKLADLQSTLSLVSNDTAAYAKGNIKTLEVEIHKALQDPALKDLSNKAKAFTDDCAKKVTRLTSLLAESRVTAHDAQEAVVNLIVIIRDLNELADSAFPAPSYPYLNTLFHKIWRDGCTYMIESAKNK